MQPTIVASSSTQDFLASEESKDLRSGVKWAETIKRMDLWEAGSLKERLYQPPAGSHAPIDDAQQIRHSRTAKVKRAVDKPVTMRQIIQRAEPGRFCRNWQEPSP